MNIKDKLGLNVFKVDSQPHISIDQEICRKECKKKYCLYVCPANVYSLKEEEIHVEWDGCLECGACTIACRPQALRWEYPRGGFGVQYRFG